MYRYICRLKRLLERLKMDRYIKVLTKSPARVILIINIHVNKHTQKVERWMNGHDYQSDGKK